MKNKLNINSILNQRIQFVQQCGFKNYIQIANYDVYLDYKQDYLVSLKKFLTERYIKVSPEIILGLFRDNYKAINQFMIYVMKANNKEYLRIPEYKDLVTNTDIRSNYSQWFLTKEDEEISMNIINYTGKGLGKGEIFFRMFTKNICCPKDNKGDLCFIINGIFYKIEVKYSSGNIGTYDMLEAAVINTDIETYCEKNNIEYNYFLKKNELGPFSSVKKIKSFFNYIIKNNHNNTLNIIKELLNISFEAQYKGRINKVQHNTIMNFIKNYEDKLIIENKYINEKLVHTLFGCVELYLYNQIDKWNYLLCMQRFDESTDKKKNNPNMNYIMINENEINNIEGLITFANNIINSKKPKIFFRSGPHSSKGMDKTEQIHYKK